MLWNDIYGHGDIIKQLEHMLACDRMPHAIMFSGAPGIGKMPVARILAAARLCMSPDGQPCGVCASCRSIAVGAHPDLIVVEPDGSYIKIDQIRRLQAELALAPYLSSRRVCIIRDAECLNDQAANRMLKTLEEPLGELLFILVTNAGQRMLPTLRSRCLVMLFQPLPVDLLSQALRQKGCNADLAQVAARLSNGCMGAALALAQPEGLLRRDEAYQIIVQLASCDMDFVWSKAAGVEKYERKEILLLLEYSGLILRDILIICGRYDNRLLYNIDLQRQLDEQAAFWNQAGLLKALAAVGKCRQAIQANANVRLASEALFIQLYDLARGG